MKSRTWYYLAAAVLACAAGVSGCDAVHGATASMLKPLVDMRTRAAWDEELRDGYDRRSNYDQIFDISDPGHVEGYRLWQGTYRGVPIALYSCVAEVRAVAAGFYGPANLCYVSVILAVEEAGYVPAREGFPARPNVPRTRARVTPIAEKRYAAEDVVQTRLMHQPATWWVIDNVGGVAVDVRDEGEGRLGFQINVLKNPVWDRFDLEALLKSYSMNGPRKIEPVTPVYTRKEFVAATIERLSTKSPTTYHDSDYMGEVDHPLWEDPETVGAVLAAAPEQALANAIWFIDQKQEKDSNYLTRLEPIAPTIMQLAVHPSWRVRAAVGKLPIGEYNGAEWKDKGRLYEIWLASPDSDCLCQALKWFAFKKTAPSDMDRVRALAKHEDPQVRAKAENLLRVLRESEDQPGESSP